MPRLTLLAGLLLCSGCARRADGQPTAGRLGTPVVAGLLPAEQGLLITERPGRLRLWQQGKGLSPPIAGVPQVYAEGQGGLLEVLPAPTSPPAAGCISASPKRARAAKPVRRSATAV